MILEWRLEMCDDHADEARGKRNRRMFKMSLVVAVVMLACTVINSVSVVVAYHYWGL